MATPYVTGASPVSFLSENINGNVGKQYQIPLSKLTVNASGQPDATQWLASLGIGPPDATVVQNLIATLAATGALTVVTPQS
jgi:hypothetical protein